jgi:hypothetical protein
MPARLTPLLSSAADEGAMVRVDLDELVEQWTLLDDERELIAASADRPGSGSRSC